MFMFHKVTYKFHMIFIKKNPAPGNPVVLFWPLLALKRMYLQICVHMRTPTHTKEISISKWYFHSSAQHSIIHNRQDEGSS